MAEVPAIFTYLTKLLFYYCSSEELSSVTFDTAHLFMLEIRKNLKHSL